MEDVLITLGGDNAEFQLAVEFALNTTRSLFVTGKAGTGKTTFLRYIKRKTARNTVVVAPTGVAAINAGGTTIHSFFQLPFGPFIPATSNEFSRPEFINDKHSIFRNIRLTSNKRELLQELELLIIDEVSMVRCDLMDAMDTVLRHFRKRPYEPFGGVQVIFIGDLFQLPPVVPTNEWELLNQFYDSPYFFSSHVIKQFPPLYLELKQIYRQNEQSFINILNRIRTNEVEWEDLERLHNCYDPNFHAVSTENYIMLSTHNKKVESINVSELQKLTTPIFEFAGNIQGDFSANALPTDLTLRLKEGAQVMFIKNDPEMVKRYFNGKIGKVTSIKEKEIVVEFPGEKNHMVLQPVTWENNSYHLNRETGEIEEVAEGTFTQYPVKLAWAITVHKSQGLTFEKAIVDLGASFAPGQVYVALSRCTSLDGLVLHSRIERRCISTDARILEFSSNQIETAALQEILKEEKELFLNHEIMKSFQFHDAAAMLGHNVERCRGSKIEGIASGLVLSEELVKQVSVLNQTADRFKNELSQLLKEYRVHLQVDHLQKRLEAATRYFTGQFTESLLKPIAKHRKSLEGKKKIKKYVKQLRELEAFLNKKIQSMEQVRELLGREE